MFFKLQQDELAGAKVSGYGSGKGSRRPGATCLRQHPFQAKTMNHATGMKASSPSWRPLHFPLLRALATVALVRSTFSAVRTTSNDGIAHHYVVMAFAPSSIPSISTYRRLLGTSDHHACIATALHMTSPPPGRRGREMEIRRKVRMRT